MGNQVDRNERRRAARRKATERKLRLTAKYARRAAQYKKSSVSVAEVKAEGVIEAGRIDDTSILYVLTRRGIRLFHMETLRDVLPRAA